MPRPLRERIANAEKYVRLYKEQEINNLISLELAGITGDTEAALRLRRNLPYTHNGLKLARYNLLLLQGALKISQRRRDHQSAITLSKTVV